MNKEIKNYIINYKYQNKPSEFDATPTAVPTPADPTLLFSELK
jgi:hypothetical protein